MLISVLVALLELPASVAGGATTSTSWTIASTAFMTPTIGYAVVTAETTTVSSSLAHCRDYVGRTSDGGRTISQLSFVFGWECSNIQFGSKLALDGSGDGFLYGPALYETHNGGRAWSRASTTGSVMQVIAVGDSVWMVENVCDSHVPSGVLPCRLEVERSTNGGRTWASDRAFARLATQNEGITFPLATVQTVLVRPSRAEAIVVSPPEIGRHGFAKTARLWVSDDGGASWTSRTLTCGITALYEFVSVPTSGPWFAVCAGEGSAGFQGKSVVRSEDLGKTWTILNRCDTPPGESCSSSIDEGYLGAFDAVTKSLLVESGTRSAINVSYDGGRSWVSLDAWLASYGDGATTIQFFSATRGMAMGSSFNGIASTSDGGRHWSNFRAVIKAPR